MLQTKFSNKLVYRLQKYKLCVVPTPKSSGLTDLVVSGNGGWVKKFETGRRYKTGEFTYHFEMKGIMNSPVHVLAHGFASRLPEIFLSKEFSGVSICVCHSYADGSYVFVTCLSVCGLYFKQLLLQLM